MNSPPGQAAPSGFFAALAQNAAYNFTLWKTMARRAARARTPPLPVGVIALGIAGLIASIAAMFLIDARASDWARHLPRGFVDVFEHITNFGLSGWFLFPFGFILLVLAAVTSPQLSRRTRGALAMLAGRVWFLFLAIALPGLFDTIIKRLIGRARPYVGGHDDPFAYMPFIWRSEYASMPSGHATTAAAAAVAIGAIWPRSRVLMWLYALTIMFSRVVVLAHHPSDVIAGAVVGGFGAIAVRRWFAARRLVFSPSDLRRFSGPSVRRIVSALRETYRCPSHPIEIK
jgi:undecaprenyl-diphosphatase